MSKNESKNSDRETAFFSAVKNDDAATVKKMVGETKQLLHAYDYDEFGGSCLNVAGGHRKNLEMVGLLVELGADVNQKSDWWAGPWSPALLSLNYDDTAVCEYLVSQGAEVDAHLAAGLSRRDRLARILDQEPNQIHARGGDGCAPLHFAGSCEIVDLLLDRGADIEARDVDHYSTPVQWVAGRHAPAARRLFDRGAKADIFSAALSGAVRVTSSLIDGDADVMNWRINQDVFPPGPDLDVHNIMTFTVGADATALHAAAVGNQPQIITLLVSRGMDVNVRGAYDSCSALHWAAWNDSVEAAIALLDSGAVIDQESGEIHQSTSMGWAIVAGSPGVAELLLNRGCERRDYYATDAEKALAGAFRQIKSVKKENYQKVVQLVARHE